MFGMKSKKEKLEEKSKLRKLEDEMKMERLAEHKKDKAFGKTMIKKCNFVSTIDDVDYYRVLCELKYQRGCFEFCDGNRCIFMKILEGYSSNVRKFVDSDIKERKR